MEAYEARALLGDWSTEPRVSAVVAVSRIIEARYPGDAQSQEDAISGALEILFDHTNIYEAGTAHRAARAEFIRASHAFTGSVAMAAIQGMPETEIARLTGISRVSIRKALAK